MHRCRTALGGDARTLVQQGRSKFSADRRLNPTRARDVFNLEQPARLSRANVARYALTSGLHEHQTGSQMRDARMSEVDVPEQIASRIPRRDLVDEQAVAIVGAGGHAKVIIGILRALGVPIFGAFDDEEARCGHEVLGVPIRACLSAVPGVGRLAVLAVGDNAARKELAEQLSLQWRACVHPRAWVDPSTIMGEGTVVCAGAMIQPDVRIGAHAIVNTGATVDHDCVLADYVHLSPGVHLAGGVSVEEGAFLGTGARVIPRVRIGAWAVVGAGATVVKDLPPMGVYVGTPARAKGAEPGSMVSGAGSEGDDDLRDWAFS